MCRFSARWKSGVREEVKTKREDIHTKVISIIL
jgi:hypothetical protein